MGTGRFIQKVSCPECRSKDNVGVYRDGDKLNGSCFGCGHFFHDINLQDPMFDHRQWGADGPPQEAAPAQHNPGQYQAPQYQTETKEQIAEYPILAVPDRWDLEEAHQYGVRSSVGPKGEIEAIYYPHYRDGRIAYWKKRVLATKNFTVIGSTAGADMFGMNGIPDGAPCIIVTEGEDDAGAARKMFRQMGKNYPCVSIPTGATLNPDTGEGVIDKPLKRQLPRLASAKVVYLCLDQDTPGIALAKAMAEELSVHTEVRIVTLPEKDARDMAKSGRTKEFWDCFCQASRYVPDSLIWAGDISLAELTTPLNEGLVLPFPELQAKMHGLRYGDNAGELTLVAGGSGVGKTTVIRAIQDAILRNYPSMKVGTIFLEEQYIKTMQAMVAAYWKVPLPVLRERPGTLSVEQWKEAQDFYGYRQLFMKHFGSLASRTLLNKCYHMYQMGIRVIALDHISMVVAGQDVGRGGERKDIDMLMQGLADFVTVTGCHVLAVVHLKRGDRQLKRNRDGVVDLDCAPYDMGGVITKTDLRGSGGLEQMAFNIWAVEGDIYGNTGMFEPNDRWIRILKNREWNELGLAGMYHQDPKTGVLIPKRCTR